MLITQGITAAAAPADTDLFRAAIFSGVNAALSECPLSASDVRGTANRARAFAAFLSGYLRRSNPDLSDAIDSIFEKV